MHIARCLLAEANVHKRFWPEIIRTAAYLKNRTLANTFVRKTPYEILFDKRPSVKNLRLFGSKTFVRIPEVKRASKWDKKAELGILLGYTEVGYRVLVNNKVITARHVDIVEENVNFIGYSDGNDDFCEKKSDDDLESVGENSGDKSCNLEDEVKNKIDENGRRPKRVTT